MENEPWRTVVLVSKHALEMEIDCAAAAAVDAMRSESIPFPLQEAKANKDSVKDHVQTHTDTHAHIHNTYAIYNIYNNFYFVHFISYFLCFSSTSTSPSPFVWGLFLSCVDADVHCAGCGVAWVAPRPE